MKTVSENRKAHFNYFLTDEYQAGIVLNGCEIKSIRNGNVNMSDSYCCFVNGELYIKNMHISEYKNSGYIHVDTTRDRKLLLKRNELKRLNQNVKTKGKTIVPVKLIINDRGRCKVIISLATGKHTYDKSKELKEKDLDREMKKIQKNMKKIRKF